MTTSHHGALGLEFENEDGTMLVEFAAGDDDAFSVGSSPHAGLRVQRPGIAPIEFYVQREDDALWLVPAYASAELRVDAQRITGRRKLSGRALIELGSDLLVLRVHEPHELEMVRAQQEDDRAQTRVFMKAPHYVEKLPAEGDQTRVAMQPPRRSNHPIAFSPTEAVPVVSIPKEAPPVVSIPKEDDVPLWQKTVEIPRFHAKTWAGDLPPSPARDRTVLDMLPAEPPRAPSPVPAPAASPRPAPAASPRPAPAARASRLRPTAMLGKLGTLAKRRPVPVALGGLAIALIGSLALVALARDPKPVRGKPRITAAASVSAAALAKAAPAAPSAASVPTVRVHSPKPPTAAASSAEPKAAVTGPLDPELVEATEHLVAGRDSQAKAAYARLARRSPDEPAYAVAARLLERMAACTDPNTRLQVSCPKVKR